MPTIVTMLTVNQLGTYHVFIHSIVGIHILPCFYTFLKMIMCIFVLLGNVYLDINGGGLPCHSVLTSFVRDIIMLLMQFVVTVQMLPIDTLAKNLIYKVVKISQLV